jgi:hypothetical protein
MGCTIKILNTIEQSVSELAAAIGSHRDGMSVYQIQDDLFSLSEGHNVITLTCLKGLLHEAEARKLILFNTDTKTWHCRAGNPND